MNRVLIILFISSILLSCSNEKGDNNEPVPSIPISSDVRTFIFGNSLVSHLEQVNITPSQETSVPHWMFLLSQSAGTTYSASGQFGFLTNHRNLPPDVNMNFDLISPPWNNDQEDFGDADFNSVWLTPANFTQFQPPTENYFDESFSPVDASIDVFDWVSQQEPGINLYIYEGWPDMAPFINSFPPDFDELAEYHAYTIGDFHDWFIILHDELLERRPELNIKMIPVGPVLQRILTETPLSEVEILEIYEDDAPHGRATLYFLASMITYHAMYRTAAPEAFQIPEIVHVAVVENYSTIRQIIEEELEQFNDGAGNSRVWY